MKEKFTEIKEQRTYLDQNFAASTPNQIKRSQDRDSVLSTIPTDKDAQQRNEEVAMHDFTASNIARNAYSTFIT